MAVSAGSVIVVVGALIAIALSVLLILRHFLPLRRTPLYLLVPVFLALALPVSIVFLVPVDLASSSATPDASAQGVTLPPRAILVAWRISYWLTFALTWFILPLLGEFVDSGYNTTRDRVFYSLRSNARFYALTLLASALGLFYVLWQNGFHAETVKGLVVALAYCIGLIQAVLLLGHGLVAVPRKLLALADASSRLRALETRAPSVHERLEDAEADLASLHRQIRQLPARKAVASSSQQAWIDDLQVQVAHATSLSISAAPAGPSVPSVVTDRYLADLSRRLQRTQHGVLRHRATWRYLVLDAAHAKALVDAQASGQLADIRAHGATSSSRGWISPRLRYQLQARLRPTLQRTLGVICALASLGVIWSELTKVVARSLSIIGWTVAAGGHVALGGQIVASFWLLYMCTCVLASFDDVKVWGNRALVRRHTYPESACWYSSQIAKMTVPLTYNFLTFMPKSIQKATTFDSFLGQLINLTPLGRWFDYLFPTLILLPAGLTLFHVYGRLQSKLGLDIFRDEEAGGGPSWVEGRELIARELQGQLHPESATLLQNAPGDARNESNQTDGSRSRASTRRADAASYSDDATEDEGAIFGFAHRVQNTWEAWQRPSWLPDFTERPRWMGASTNEPGHAGNQTDSGGGLERWFGRPTQGRVRL